jgi:anti-sigma B factor antagonist
MAAVDKDSAAAIAVTDASDLDGEMVISIAGELDMSNVDVVRAQVEPLLGANPTSLVFDLSELSFMDSSGIALLVQVASRVTAISLRHVPELIERVLEATGVTDVLAVER